MATSVWLGILLSLGLAALFCYLKFRKARAAEQEPEPKPEPDEEPEYRDRGYGYNRSRTATPNPKPRNWFRAHQTTIAGWVTIAFAALFVLTLATNSFTIVNTRSVGIVTEFNRPVGTLDAGIHPKPFWRSVPELDGAIQTNNRVGDGTDGNPKGCVDVRIANNSIACVDVTIAWRIKLEEADTLYQDYRTFENIQNNLVSRELIAALNQVFGKINPLDSSVRLDFAAIGQQTLDAMKTTVGDKIEIQKIIIPIVRFDGDTQRHLNDFQRQIAQTRVSTERQNTARADAEANRILTESLTNQVLMDKCLRLIENGATLPTAFQCMMGIEAPPVAVTADK